MSTSGSVRPSELRPAAPTGLRPAACLGVLTVATAIAALVLGRFVVVPMLAHHHTLVDANLARALCHPLHLRLAEIALAATIVAFVLVPRWTRSRLASALAMIIVVATAAWRALLVPELYAAFARVDLVAGRPVDRLQELARLEELEQAAVTAIALLLVALGWAALRSDPMAAQVSDAPREPVRPEPTCVSGTIDSAA